MLKIQGVNLSLNSKYSQKNVENQKENNNLGFKAVLMKSALIPEAKEIFIRHPFIIEAEANLPSVAGLGLLKLIVNKPLPFWAEEIRKRTAYANSWANNGGTIKGSKDLFRVIYDKAEALHPDLEKVHDIKYMALNNYAYVLLAGVMRNKGFKGSEPEIAQGLELLQKLKKDYSVDHHDDLISYLKVLTANKA
jgi:hypothetical protein